MPTGKTKSRCAWEAVNLPAIRCLHAMCFGYATGNKNLAEGGSNDKRRTERTCRKRRGRELKQRGHYQRHQGVGVARGIMSLR